jgi:hypothetical protein
VVKNAGDYDSVRGRREKGRAGRGTARHAPGFVLVRTGGDMVGLALRRRNGARHGN